jgi:hypothetical protein
VYTYIAPVPIGGPGPFAISIESINSFYQDIIVPHGVCFACEFASNAMVLPNAYMIAKKAAEMTFSDKVNVSAIIFKYLFWDSWKGKGNEIGRDILIV